MNGKPMEWICPKCLKRHATFSDAQRCDRSHKGKTLQEIRSEVKR